MYQTMRTLHLGISVADQFQVLINEKYNKNSNKKEIETIAEKVLIAEKCLRQVLIKQLRLMILQIVKRVLNKD